MTLSIRVVVAFLATAAAAIKPSFAQCSALAHIESLAADNGGAITATYDDGDVSLFVYGTDGGTPVLYATDALGAAHMCVQYSEDASGTGQLTDGSVTATFECGKAGVVFKIAGMGLDSEVFGLTDANQMIVFGQSAFKKVFGEAFGWTGSGDETLTLDNAIDADHLTANGTNEMLQQFTVTAALYRGSVSSDEGVATFWIGTLATDAATIPCAGVCVTNDNGSFLVPLVSFNDESYGLSIFGSNPPAPPVCAFWDATAQGEQDNLDNDYAACNLTILGTHVAADILCGAGAVVCCATVLIPNPISTICCPASIGCLGLSFTHDIEESVAMYIEGRRVRNCICIGATTRAAGGTAAACSFTCPKY